MVLLRQIQFNLAIVAIVDAILMWIYAVQVPSLHRDFSKVLETGHLPKLPNVHANICTNVVHTVGHNFALVCVDFHSTCPCSVYESVGKVLRFIVAAVKIDAVGDSWAVYEPATNGDGVVVHGTV